jgi:ubiquitin carboxyl-terminal hydrolase 5/13
LFNLKKDIVDKMSAATVNDVLPIIRSQISRVKAPSTHDKVYKDECVYSFDSPFSDTGLYVNLITYHGVGERYLQIDAQKSNARLYLHEKYHQVPVETDKPEEESHITKLAIGVEGGFDTKDKYKTEKEHYLVVLSENREIQASIPLPNDEIPEYILNVIAAIDKHEGMKLVMQVATWDADNEKVVSKYANDLIQVNPEKKKISQDPKQWKDEASDATDNLWLNLSTGYIGGGRKNWDGTGGSGSALQHYIDTGRKYPLVVKLGTITPHGADVWSYAEDEDKLVIDPKLAEHLSFWGIDAMKLEKTEKTLDEMTVALNITYDWSKIIEKDENLKPATGPGLIGLRNIGSSCYMNSLLQCIFHIPEVRLPSLISYFLFCFLDLFSFSFKKDISFVTKKLFNLHQMIQQKIFPRSFQKLLMLYGVKPMFHLFLQLLKDQEVKKTQMMINFLRNM